ncbi:MAG: ATP-binding protein [Flavobacteriales bacterium]|nr:ATP-binding protein [Flavobacteriales bacterium]
MAIVGRKEEIRLMQSYLSDNNSHFFAVVGRRRVGKTFLIREVYNENKVFEMTGLKDANLKTQLVNFSLQMSRHFSTNETIESWLLAFNQLSVALEKTSTPNKPVVFFDELPWIAGRRSGFMEALAHWWNSWASQQNIIVVVCGSAASWMLERVVNAKGGLHNRITKTIHLMPFTLAETKEFLEVKNIEMTYYQIVQLYLAMGGIPHYLNQISKGKSAAQIIQETCFDKDGTLRNEFNNLYTALFENASNHISIIRALASTASGMERSEILNQTNLSDGGSFTRVLNELEASGFISTFSPLENKKKDTLFRLTDEYSLFYLKFIEGKSTTETDHWMRTSQSQEYKIWCGYAFENLCIKHVHNIKKALGISGVSTSINSFLHRSDDTFGQGFQIDMLIDRKDEVMNICEMKFYADKFTINASYAANLRTKKVGLRAVTSTKKMVVLTFITTYGLFENAQKSELVDNDFTIDVLFE